MAENQFLVSVADAYIFDTDTDTLVLQGKALLNSSIEQTMQSSQIFAGKGSQLVYEYNYQKMLNVTIEDSQFNEAYICLHNNTTISQALADFYSDEIIILDEAGKGVLTELPVGNVYVKMENGQHLTVSPNGKEINVAQLGGKEAAVTYRYKTATEEITINSNAFPKSYKLVLNSDIFTNAGKYAEMQITVPRFKPDGALTIGLQHDSVSSSTLNGKSLADNKGNYAYLNMRNVNETDIQLQAIAATPSEVELHSGIAGDASQLTIYGIRGGIYSNVTVTDTASYVSDNPAVVTVNSTGLVELGPEATVGNTTIIRVTNGTLTDIVNVKII